VTSDMTLTLWSSSANEFGNKRNIIFRPCNTRGYYISKTIVHGERVTSGFWSRKIMFEGAQKTRSPPPMTPNKTAPPVASMLAVRPAAPPLPPLELVPVGVGVVPVLDLLLTMEEALEEIEETLEETLDWLDTDREDRLLVIED
jgi:hypothetical protein